MSKINTSVRGGQLSELEKRAAADLPTGTPVEATPGPSPAPPGGALDQLMAGPDAQPQPAPPDLEAIQSGVGAGLDYTIEAARQEVPDIQQRAQAPVQERWLREVTSQKSPISAQSDGGMQSRAAGIMTAVQRGEVTPSASFTGDAPIEGSFASAIEKAGAGVRNATDRATVPDREYAYIGALVTENTMADLSFADETEVDPVDQALGVDKSLPQQPTGADAVKRAKGNEQLGQKIHQEYQRKKGVAVPEKLPAKEAAAVGQVFKDMWAMQNPTLVKQFKDENGVNVLQMTAEGATALEKGETDRKRYFPKQNVQPSKIPLDKGKLPGDKGKNVVRNASGAVGKPEFGSVIEEARRNMATVPNVVDKQRAKILFSTILPVLQSGDHNSWMAEINNFGPSKLQAYRAEQKSQQRRLRENPTLNEEPYSPEAVLNNLKDKIAQEVQSIAQNRNGANYLTYNVQGFNGRITPQQTFFNPTTSKAVRFVTRNATPSRAKPGGRVEKNLRQMYAMMMVKGADALLPEERDAALVKASPQLEAWGDTLAAAITMTDAQYDQVSQAIAEGKPLNDPAYGEIPQLALDPEKDAELIDKIMSKEEDGPHFIDGLIDYAKYAKAKRAGQTYYSYFNAYIDGKTNGIASNGIQMGSLTTAEATGVLRDNTKELLDKGDIRDQLKNISIESIDEGWDGKDDEIISDLNHVARAVFGNRALNKKTTMTFGYGKEIASFGKDIEQTIGLLSETDPSIGEAADATGMSRADLAKTLLGKYQASLESVLSEDALNSRALMRGAAAIHAAMDSLFSIKSYTGMDLNLGRDAATGEGQEVGKYRIYDDEGKAHTGATYEYKNKPTASAARSRTDAEGNVTSTPGEYAYGGSLPGPVQSLDAATVAMSAAGKSWDRLKTNSEGNPYMHSIYDAFKTDANGFDVTVEEVNKNWMKAASEWSYLEQTLQALRREQRRFDKAFDNRNGNELLNENERRYMDWMLALTPSKQGNLDMNNFRNKMSKFKEYGSYKEIAKVQEDFKKGMAAVGYNVGNPPAEPTVRQMKRFVGLLRAELNLESRLASMIARTNTNKRKVVQQLKARGFKTPSGESIALQYYAH